MPQVVIENPAVNSPFAEPSPQFRFSDDCITNEILKRRRPMYDFVPIPLAKKRGDRQLTLDTEWKAYRQVQKGKVNEVRAAVTN